MIEVPASFVSVIEGHPLARGKTCGHCRWRRSHALVLVHCFDRDDLTLTSCVDCVQQLFAGASAVVRINLKRYSGGRPDEARRHTLN